MNAAFLAGKPVQYQPESGQKQGFKPANHENNVGRWLGVREWQCGIVPQTRPGVRWGTTFCCRCNKRWYEALAPLWLWRLRRRGTERLCRIADYVPFLLVQLVEETVLAEIE